MHKSQTLIAVLLAVGISCGLAGCDRYVIEGMVVEGDVSAMTFVDADDPRFQDVPVSSAQVMIRRDPDRPGQAETARVISHSDGTFTISLREFGAGWMEEQWEIIAVRQGYVTVESRQSLPRKGARQRLLIIMRPGFSAPPRHREWQEQYERFR